MNDKSWVNRRLAALDSAKDWRPNAARALGRVREKDRSARAGRRKRIWAAAVAAVACLALPLVPVSRACALPSGVCAQPLWKVVFQKKVDAVSVPAEPPPAPADNYKVSGSQSAPITCEVYSDYECPHCAVFFNETIPMLVADYVAPGKVKLVHRDFPLPQHRFARLAARYANAAGHLGHYELVASQIFKTQSVWDQTGDIDAQVALVVPPEIMQKVRDLVNTDSKLDDTVSADIAMGRADQLSQTPSVVIVSKGKRQLIPGGVSFGALKIYLDGLLAQ